MAKSRGYFPVEKIARASRVLTLVAASARRVVTSRRRRERPLLAQDQGRGGMKAGISPFARSATFIFARTLPYIVVIHSSPGFRS